MKKITVCSTVGALIIGLMLTYNSLTAGEVKNSEIDNKNIDTKSQVNIDVVFSEPDLYISKNDDDVRPVIKSVNLDGKLLDHIWKLCNDNDFSYTLFLAISAQESNMKTDSTNYNRNGTVDKGLMQINSTNIGWLSKEADINKVDPNNPYHSVSMAIELLKYERDYFRSLNMSEEQVFNATILAYHLGRDKSVNYIKKYGYNHPYVKSVKNMKNKFEQEMELQ